ncbi:hypothetical protein APHWI1_0744 [Anaplasma phagocytophilum str. ApWI1]|uniref:Uncharacterized protein n=4 Tax=Anaplasma phagocytophilum TaxID=948 RepID=A0A0F3MXT0_ANAPH|nr:hypothetical protein EPHNCH_1553 [Anaplasma phagocytophilum str. NCH-1]KJV60482.1 hypothetical protein APHWEB_0773 [Anaplasma phagocytophilum str. Webster]KJV65119.1 hypothetical protein APHMUC_0981 [Anaplasma phagocytophilum str. ApMUC09]KJV68028.1 hypothetical protein APHNP_0789 [Anaplasma phagocytophilum str. ApNP]KJV84533.1 hypothetical protein APHWI1_0744 [Anaplasma phagocytophilum str. ApWI1]KJV98059.1 hypothetical protein OTSANNIE_1516 [Anaplasma phagocytophilum str. Annie]
MQNKFVVNQVVSVFIASLRKICCPMLLLGVVVYIQHTENERS